MTMVEEKELRDAACMAIAECVDIAQHVNIELDAGFSPNHAAATMRVAIAKAPHDHLAATFKRSMK